MTIAFICGSLEQGKDGVGDYTRRLAGELVKQGHSVAMMALYDNYVHKPVEETQLEESMVLPVLRIPAGAASKARIVSATTWIAALDPDWLSLQFVPFAFHNKGLPFSLAYTLTKIGRGRNWHIMFHELWVGVEANASFKISSWGWLQKQLIKFIISTLKPAILHTQTRLYQAQLNKLGLDASYLPLFGNIPLVKDNEEPLSSEQRKRIILVSFGAIHAGVPVNKLTAEVVQYAASQNAELILKIVGRSGAELAHWSKVWQEAGARVEVLGEQSTEQISRIFQGATIGISTTPLVLVEKSGSVAAMLEHGLPVLCVRQPTSFSYNINDIPLAGVLQYVPGNFEACICSSTRLEMKSLLGGVAEKFSGDLLESLEEASCKGSKNHSSRLELKYS
ncbi:hypothetical protein [Pontibacter sp. H249]|uniref:hypothetical protein n=1 Tax=Pontibacter sp. H249 TaxID=3133420 RepID=UPI0030C1E52A